MPLATLIIGTEDGCAAALLPIAGHTLVEYQVRTARAAGAGHIVVLVDQIPAVLVAAFDRLRGDGIDIEIARDTRDAADRIHPEEQLLVFAEGIVADGAMLDALIAAGKRVLVTVPDSEATAAYERIDATDRWAGLALLDGQLLRETVAMLGDWTLGPTLLRAALQGRATRIPVPEGTVLGKAVDANSAGALSRKLVAVGQAMSGGMISRKLVQPLATRAVPFLFQRGVPLDLVAVLPIVMLGASLLLAATGWPAAALAVQFIACFPAAAGTIMAAIGARTPRSLAWYSQIRLAVFCVTMLLMGKDQMDSGLGWGALILALWAITSLILARRPRDDLGELELALLLLLIATCAGNPLIGFGLIIAGSLASEGRARLSAH